MRALYLIIGFFLAMLWIVPTSTQLVNDVAAAWQQHTNTAKIMAYYEGHTAGVEMGYDKAAFLHADCAEELDQLRGIVRQKVGN